MSGLMIRADRAAAALGDAIRGLRHDLDGDQTAVDSWLHVGDADRAAEALRITIGKAEAALARMRQALAELQADA